MSWGQNNINARHLFGAALLLTASAAAADILVVRSTGPSAKSFPPGKRLPESGKITLKAADQLVVLDGRGTRTLRGPGNFVAGAAPQAGAGARSAPAPQRRARIGAVRTLDQGEPRSPTIWHVDVSKSSNICLAEPNNVTLWRGDASKPVTLVVTRVKDNQTQKLTWAENETTLTWPTQLPVSNDTDFVLNWDGATTPTTLRFKTLPQKPAGLEDMASLLITNGCAAQLDLLIETVKLPEEKTPAG